MPKYKAKRGNGRSSAYKILSAVIVLIMALAGFVSQKMGLFSDVQTLPATSISADGQLAVHFIDVGQGDAELIIAPTGEAMLIDAGPGSSETSLLAYLSALGISELEYAVFTHPHEDHIGGADGVVNNIDVKKVIMPDAESSTVTFEKLLTAIDKRGCEVDVPAVGDTYSLGDAVFTVLAPNSSGYDSLNNYSIVMRLDYGESSFLFTGDAEALSEKEILANSPKLLDCDVLKAGHHGSSTSSSQDFLDAVTPDIAVISCGAGNDYGHPHSETLTKYSAMNIRVLRTDLSGSIVITSDGHNITVAGDEAA
ncbi:MAG: ComEC/Rec2 family competence protein [Eubacteriales bacterium]